MGIALPFKGSWSLAAAVAVLILPTSVQAHPLDSLTSDEIAASVKLLRDAGHATEQSRYPMMSVLAPPKEEVWSWQPGQSTRRRAMVVVKDGSKLFEARLDLDRGLIESWTPIRGSQSSILPEEWLAAGKLVKADTRWQAAMHARGITEYGGIFCDALSVGYFGRSSERSLRLLKVPCYDARETNNVYARPIEGVLAIVDIEAKRVLEVSDSGVVPVSQLEHSLEEKDQPQLRPALRAVVSGATPGRNFAINDGIVTWQNWSFHLGFDRRVGPILSTVRYKDGERQRPVLYQGHVSEMFVPYMDPDAGWSYRSYMDVGEYGFGNLASRLIAGVDCPTGAVLISLTLPNHRGVAYTARDILCAFERQSHFPIWRRFDTVSGHHEGRPGIEFVLRAIPTVGNYDYVYDWVLSQTGEISVEMGATGVAAAKGVRSPTADASTALSDTGYGTLVSPNLVATNHDHFFSFRFDLDVDGSKNKFVREQLVTRTLPGDRNSRRSLWVREHVPTNTEAAIKLDHRPEVWRVTNPNVKTGLGNNPAFEIAGGHSATSLLEQNDWPQRRAAFSTSPLWVTKYRPEQLYAAGSYPNQSSGGEGLPKYVDGESIDNVDLVVWYTMGFHHVPRPEDWPVLPTVQHSVRLRPSGFFDQNPALDVRREFAH